MALHESTNRCGWHLWVKKCHLYLKYGNSIYDDLRLTKGNRFIKQRLHWTLPKLATPQQCDRWSDLMPLMTWELWRFA